MLRPRLAPILFSRQVQPAYICLPSRNGQGGRSCTCDLLVPNPDASGLLTLHPGNWLPDLDSPRGMPACEEIEDSRCLFHGASTNNKRLNPATAGQHLAM